MVPAKVKFVDEAESAVKRIVKRIAVSVVYLYGTAVFEPGSDVLLVFRPLGGEHVIGLTD